MRALERGENPFAQSIEQLLGEPQETPVPPRGEDDELDQLLDELMEQPATPETEPPAAAVTPGWLGVSLGVLSEEVRQARGLTEPGGALLQGVHAGGPAARAGVRAGDIVLAVGDRPVRDRVTLIEAITSRPPGAKVVLTLLGEDGKRRSVTVQLGRKVPGR
jgi:S1-C subfamily serine protease